MTLQSALRQLGPELYAAACLGAEQHHCTGNLAVCSAECHTLRICRQILNDSYHLQFG
jgi:hypothetical protein